MKSDAGFKAVGHLKKNQVMAKERKPVPESADESSE